jgi:hypothetical protein
MVDCPHAQKEILPPKANEEDQDKAAARESLGASSSGCAGANVKAKIRAR